MSLAELGNDTAERFQQTYGRPPRWIAAAPGRVNVIGEHTDYNDGFVLPMAIDRYTVVAAAPAANGANTVQLQSTLGNSTACLDLSQPLKPGPKGAWSNYPAGVIAGFLSRGLNAGGFDALVHSTVPLGGGLSSSAALEVATATLLEAMTGQQVRPGGQSVALSKGRARLRRHALRHHGPVHLRHGPRKDHLLLLDCRSRKTELVPMTDPSVALLIANTNVKHELTGGEYAKRRAQCEAGGQTLGVRSLRDADAEMLERARARMDDVVFRRARHVLSEIERTLHAAEGVRASNWPTVGQLMYASHASLRDDYEVSCAELDAVVEIAQGIGRRAASSAAA